MLISGAELGWIRRWLDSQVCTDGGLVLVAEPLVHILVHKGSLPDPTTANTDEFIESAITHRVNVRPTYPLSPRMITYEARQTGSRVRAEYKSYLEENTTHVERSDGTEEDYGGEGVRVRSYDMWT